MEEEEDGRAHHNPVLNYECLPGPDRLPEYLHARACGMLDFRH